jgi:hypothetical protein
MEEIELALARVYQDARTHRNSYFEKLALLDGGTVALIITAVLGPLHGQVRHKYTLGVGLSLLVLSMLILLARNYLAVEIEFHSAARTTNDVDYMHAPEAQREARVLNVRIHRCELAGLWLTAVGLLLLLIEVWLILA